MKNISQKYRKIKNIDKVIAFFAITILVTAAAYSAEDLNYWLVAAVISGFLIITHFFLSATYKTGILLVFLLQLVAIAPVGTLYSIPMIERFGASAYVLALMVVVPASYLIPYATYKFSSGRWWFKLLLAYLLFDFATPVIAMSLGFTNIAYTAALGFALAGITCIPWSRQLKRVEKDYPQEVKKKDATEAIISMLKNVDGANIQKLANEAVDFTLTKDGKIFYVSVLGLNHPVKIVNGMVHYGPYNIKPLVYQTALETHGWKFRKNHIPVIINATDTSNDFAEIETHLKQESRKSRHVIVTTPSVFMDILSNKD